MKFLKMNSSLKVFLFSCMIALYFILFAVPFADKHGFFIQNSPPQANMIFPYFLLTTPIFMVYIWFLFINFKKIRFLKSIHYPIVILNIFLGILIYLFVFGGAVLWVVTMSFPFFIVFIISFIVGAIKDIQYWGMHKRIK